MIDNSFKLEQALRKSAVLALLSGGFLLIFLYTFYFEQIGLGLDSYFKLAQCLLSGVLCSYLLISSWARLWDALGIEAQGEKNSLFLLDFVLRKILALIAFFFLCLRLGQPFGLLFCVTGGLLQLFATLYFCSRK